MARATKLEFDAFVRGREAERPISPDGDPHAYAYAWDRTTRRAFETAKPVEMVMAAAVRAFKNFGKAELLGHSVKVGPRQFPRVYGIARHCADTLGIPVPTLYIVNDPRLNAATYGTNDDSFILVHSALVDHMSDAELTNVIGHECGHIHNSHVVYLTALYYLTQVAGAFVRGIGLPALLGLRAWSRRAEVTCDRAGALCVKDLGVAFTTITKLALGSRKLYEELNMDAFLEQHEEANASVGRFAEITSTHPWLPKRALALKTFGDSQLFRRHAGLGDDGLTMQAVDERVHEIIKIVG